jgi:vacuolar protein sorting-associated protein 54
MTGGRHLSQQEKSTILARNLRALDAGDAEELLVTVYVGVTETLRRVSTQVKVLLDVASSIGDESTGIASGPLSPPGRKQSSAGMEAQEEIHKSLDMSNLLGQAVDVAQDKIVKLLRVRNEQSINLALAWFLRYFTLNLHFATECESISGRSGKTLNTIVNGQIKEFVSRHGDTERQQLAQGMESDQWDAKDFEEKDQHLLDQILASSTRDAQAWAEGSKVWIPHSDGDDDDLNGQADTSQTNGTSKAKSRSAMIESENFILPNSALLCMTGISHFLHLIVGIPSMTSDISTSLVSYLQLFNSRCTQLILGAGATRSAGLKNINTKHLALASQALAFIAAIIPHVRECVRRHCGSGVSVSSVMGEFDKIRRLYQEHQNSIYDKLVEIMSGRAAAGAKKMKGIPWDEPTDAIHDYIATVSKETTTLHKHLTKNLPEGTVRLIMIPVFKNYKETFGSAIADIEPQTEAGRDRYVAEQPRGGITLDAG